MHFMDAVAAEQRDLDAEREHVEHELALEARYVARRAQRFETRAAQSVESWYLASCGYRS